MKKMSLDEFQDAVVELYQGEVMGEVLFNDMLTNFDDSHQRHKIASLLQLETETKARLRPLVVGLGIHPAELEKSRQVGHKFAEGLRDLSWVESMERLRDVVRQYVLRYREILAKAPSEYQAPVASMVLHEQALLRFTELELTGEVERSLDDVNAQLHWPLTNLIA